MYALDCTLADGARKSLILTSGEFLTHRVKAKGVKITNNIPEELKWQFEPIIIFAPLNDNDFVVKRSLTNFALNQEYANLNFGDDSIGPNCQNWTSDEYCICFNNASDEFTGEFMLIVNKWDGDSLTNFTDEDVEIVKQNIIVEPTDVFDYKGWLCDQQGYVLEEDLSENTGMALLPPTNDPNKSMSFIYRVPPDYKLIVDHNEGSYNNKISYRVFEGDPLVGFNGMVEDVEHFRYCLPTWSLSLIRFFENADGERVRLAPNNPVDLGEKDSIGPGDTIYANTTSSNKGVIINIPKYGYKFVLEHINN